MQDWHDKGLTHNPFAGIDPSVIRQGEPPKHKPDCPLSHIPLVLSSCACSLGLRDCSTVKHMEPHDADAYIRMYLYRWDDEKPWQDGATTSTSCE